jgi:preprotein translocase subunit SecF
MNIIKYKWIFLSFSIALIIASIVGLSLFGFHRGIDFTGGTLWQVSFDKAVTRDALTMFAKDKLKLEDPIITEQEGTNGFLIKAKEISEVLHQEYLTSLKKQFGGLTELSFQTISGAVGSELVDRALWALGINLFAISLYVAYAFRKVSYPVSSWKYAFITLITLFHDALIPVGMYAFLGHFLGLEVDTNFIVAVLLIIGFSVHDTIVVFDRIRENLRHSDTSKVHFGELVNRSINETFARSLNTSLTLFIVLVVFIILGATTLKYFTLTILVGTVIGTYSSIFIASPLLVLWNKRKAKNG